ncbi:MAG TPA: MarR family transcriptional regulator [Myxococcales bacterium]|jgi:DNA-binding MarR family transcriptional regulator
MQTISPQDFPEAELKRFGDVLKSIGKYMTLRDPIIGASAAETEFSSSQIHALMWCGTEGQLTMGELARRSNVTEKTITGIVDRLEKNGYLERQRDPNDRRVIHVVITDKGREQFHMLEKTMRLRFAAFLSLLDPPDRQSLYGILEKVLERVSQQATTSGKSNL